MGHELNHAEVESIAAELRLTIQRCKVCILRYVDGHTEAVIALLLDISQPRVCQHLKAARRQYPDLPARLLRRPTEIIGLPEMGLPDSFLEALKSVA